MTKIGFIGQGWIGRHYADDFEGRLYSVVRYALEEPYVQNKDAIKECDMVFIAVPTPTTPDGYSYAPVESALECLKPGATAVIKSTLVPGTTDELQKKFPDVFVMHSPEFLREAVAAHDAANPDRNLIGIPVDNPEYNEKAKQVLRVLPEAPYNKIMTAREAELVKYAGNGFLMTKVLFMNIMYDLVRQQGGDWAVVREAMIQDPRIGASHTKPVHSSGHVDAPTTEHRGAGGHCFIKDFEALRKIFTDTVGQEKGTEMLTAMTNYNIELLTSSNKDIDLLKGVFGDDLQVK